MGTGSEKQRSSGIERLFMQLWNPRAPFLTHNTQRLKNFQWQAADGAVVAVEELVERE
jgi:hypothetical protein